MKKPEKIKIEMKNTARLLPKATKCEVQSKTETRSCLLSKGRRGLNIYH